jgi:hypothetical protein
MEIKKREIRNAYNILISKLQGENPPRIFGFCLENNIKFYHTEMWVDLTELRIQWRVLKNDRIIKCAKVHPVHCELPNIYFALFNS